MSAKSKGLTERVLITLVTTVGLVVLLFPTIANWFSSLGFEAQRGAYEEAAQELTPEERERILDSAREYNASLPSGPLRDPYMLEDDGSVVDLRDDTAGYEKQLNFGEGLMGWVHIPNTRTALPIYHGTDEETLVRGAGHLHGSALPVGGPSSHSVITAHSGRAEAALFSDLGKLRKGDVFYTDVVGEQFYYRVDSIDIVEPIYSGEKLRQVQGKDYVTLLTCTPTGVNSHRLLVRGERIDGPEAEQAKKEIRAKDYTPDFPWWIPLVVGTSAATWVLLTAIDKKRRRRSPAPASTAASADRASVPTAPSQIAGRHRAPTQTKERSPRS